MAFIRQGNQGYQMPNQLQSGGNELLGTGTMTGKKQETTSGQPGGWTNIQDYLGANSGDQTNINLAKQRTGEKITEGANKINEQVSNLTSLPTAQGYSQDQLQNILQTDNYDMAQQGLSQSQGMNALTALPTVDQEITGYAPIEEGVANVDPNKFSSVSSFIGDLAPSSPTYSSGQKAFDAMLLQGSPEFKTTFVPEIKQQYQDMYLNPLSEARTGRQGQRDQAQQGLTQAQQDWQAGIDSWLGEQEQAVSDILANQNTIYNQTYDSFFGENGKGTRLSSDQPWQQDIVNQMRNEFELRRPDESTAMTAYVTNSGDDTRIADMTALYNMLGRDPKYAPAMGRNFDIKNTGRNTPLDLYDDYIRRTSQYMQGMMGL